MIQTKMIRSVDGDQRAEEVGDVCCRACITAVPARRPSRRANAARTPPRSSAAQPARRRPARRGDRAAQRAACRAACAQQRRGAGHRLDHEQACAVAAGSPRRTPASTSASASSAQYAGPTPQQRRRRASAARAPRRPRRRGRTARAARASAPGRPARRARRTRARPGAPRPACSARRGTPARSGSARGRRPAVTRARIETTTLRASPISLRHLARAGRACGRARPRRRARPARGCVDSASPPSSSTSARRGPSRSRCTSTGSPHPRASARAMFPEPMNPTCMCGRYDALTTG